MKKKDHIDIYLEFKNNRLLNLLYGEQDAHLKRIEQHLNVMISARGNHVLIHGQSDQCHNVEIILKRIYHQLESGGKICLNEVDSIIRLTSHPQSDEVHDKPDTDVPNTSGIKTRNKFIKARTPGQIDYINALKEYDLVFALGPAGTGKTYLAVAMAVANLIENNIDRIILSRPAVEAGEKLGFLPGDIKEKIDPYLQPLYDSLHDMLPSDQITKCIESRIIEVAPLAFMRGRTLNKAHIILDEAQNTTIAQMKMFLTRLGEKSKMVITGDLTQIDLPKGTQSGLVHAIEIFSEIKNIKIMCLTEADILRHPLVAQIVKAYNQKL